MGISREKEALSAYFRLLEKKGASGGILYKRSLFLDQLTPLLADKASDRITYSEAIKIVMAKIPAENWHENLNTAREFYPFWMQDIKSIAAFSLQGGFDINPLQWAPKAATLKSFTDRLKTETFDRTDARHLSSYTKALKEKGADQALLDTRVNLIKILLMQLKGAPIDDARVYRITVDSILPLFKSDETKQLFLYVIREFYVYWIGNLELQPIATFDSH